MYHGGDSMVGNTVNKIYKDVQKEDSLLLETYNDNPDTKETFKTIWNIKTKCINLINKEDISDEENENLAKEMTKFTEVFPILFPQENLTRKYSKSK